MSTSTSFATYNLRGMIPHEGWGWDDYINRLSRYDVYNQYYNNLQYHRIVTYSETIKATERLYKHARGVYNPVNRLVELYVSQCAGVALDLKDPSNSPAFPIDTENEALLPVIARLWRDSRWQQKKELYVRYGVMLGDTFLKVVDDPARQQVRLEVINPTCVKAIHKNEVGMIDYAVIEYYIHDPLFPDKANEYAKYTEVITPDYFRTYRNGEQFAYYVSPIGDPIAEWENEYGFVPLYHAMHNDVGMTWGANAYYGALQKINELNDIASIINDGARNQVRFPIAITGATSTQVSLGGSSNDTPAKDSLNVITLPADATIQALPPNINLADGLQTIQEILAELERDFPELSLHRIRDGGNLTAPGVKSAYSDAIARIQSAMVVYDTTLVEAQRGAIAIAGMRGYRGYEGFGMGVLYEDALDHNVKLRPVINDTLTQAERINLIAQVADNSANSVLLAELGLNEDEVEAIVQKSDNRMGMTYTSQLSQAPQEDLGLDPEQVGEANADSRIQDADLFSALQMMEAMDE